MTNQYATILFYVEDRAICEDSFGDLFYTDVPELFGEPGNVIEIASVSPISELSLALQMHIKATRDVLPEKYLQAIRDGMEAEDRA